MSRIKLKYVHPILGHDGVVRYYFRRRGWPNVPLRGKPGSEEFMADYAAALASMPEPVPVAIGASRTMPGTIDALVVTYYGSGDWTSLEADTRKTRRRILERLREEHGRKRVVLMQREHFVAMLDKIEKATAKLHWYKAIRGLMKAAVPSMRRDDPTDGIPAPKLLKTKGHHTWTADEIAQYRAYWPLGTQQRLVMEFALETVSRRGEVVRLGPQHVKGGRIRIERTHGSLDVSLPLTPALKAACEAMSKGHLTYIVTAGGKPRSKFGLGNDFAKWATEAGLPKRCRMHGLKKAGMTRLADAGGTSHELMAVSGHKSPSMVEVYTRNADRERLATTGMAKLEGHSENGNVANSRDHESQTGAKGKA